MRCFLLQSSTVFCDGPSDGKSQPFSRQIPKNIVSCIRTVFQQVKKKSFHFLFDDFFNFSQSQGVIRNLSENLSTVMNAADTVAWIASINTETFIFSLTWFAKMQLSLTDIHIYIYIYIYTYIYIYIYIYICINI